jgi:hypothetical protein
MSGTPWSNWENIQRGTTPTPWSSFQNFSAEERDAMERMYTPAQRRQDSGGVWCVGGISYPQAISADHARRLWASEFCGPAPPAELYYGPIGY